MVATVQWATGFESQQNADDDIGGNGAYSTAQHRTGAVSYRCNAGSGSAVFLSVNPSVTAYICFGLYVVALPSGDRIICGEGTFNRLVLTSDGHLKYYNYDGTLIGTSSSAISAGQWYWIGFRGSGGTGVDLIQIDGTTVLNGTAYIGAGSGSKVGCSGTEAVALDLYLDDVVVLSGGFLPPSKVDTAFPISDNTRTGATDAGGGTSNLYQALDNTPPAGVASASESANPKASIKFPASTAATYIANLESYSTLGIASGDTVESLRWFIRHGEDIATGTKNGSFSATTNPDYAYYGDFVFGLDQGAHSAEGGFWKTHFGLWQTRPSVTLATSPTGTITRVSESRVGCVDAFGMVVVWTPAGNITLDVPVLNLADTGYAPALAATLVVPVKALTLTGYAPDVSQAKVLDVPTKALTTTGYAPTTTLVATIPVKALTVTGFGPSVPLWVPTASLTLTGYAPGAQIGYVVPVKALSLATFGPSVPYWVPTASLTVTGYAPAANPGLVIPQASLVLTGYAPSVDIGGAGITITPDVANLAASGYAPGLTLQYDVAVKALNALGYVPGLVVLVTVPVVALVGTGYSPALQVSAVIPVKALVVTGFGPDVPKWIGTASLAVAGYAPSVPLWVPTGSLTLIGYAPGVRVSAVVPTASLTTAGYSPALSVAATIPVASLVLTGYAPDLGGQITLTIPTASFVASGYAPGLSWQMTVPVAALVAQGYIPGLQKGYVVPVKSLTTTGYASALQAALSIPTKALALTPFGPSVPYWVPTASGLVLTGYVPTVSGAAESFTLTVPTKWLHLAGWESHLRKAWGGGVAPETLVMPLGAPSNVELP